MRIAVVTNPTNTPLTKYDPHAREQTEVTCSAVCDSLKELGYQPEIIEAGPSLLADLKARSPKAIFNLATGYNSKREQANIAAMLELSGIPFTGSSFHAHVIGLHKHLAKMMFSAYGVATPGFRVIDTRLDRTMDTLQGMSYPVIVKPASEGSSVGISESSVTKDPNTVMALVDELLSSLGPPVLVEEFVSGREFTVAILGHEKPMVLPVEEIIFDVGLMFTYGVKCRDQVTAVCPAEISGELRDKIQAAALGAFKAVGCRDIARVDIRLSEQEVPYVLEINTLPGLMPEYSEVPRICRQVGMSYTQMIKTILDGALSRWKY